MSSLMRGWASIVTSSLLTKTWRTASHSSWSSRSSFEIVETSSQLNLTSNLSLCILVPPNYRSNVAELDFFHFRYLIVCMDCTVFPANAIYVGSALKTFSALLSMTSNAIGLLLYPVWQKQTTEGALIRHRQQLDNALLKAGLSMRNLVQFLWSKPDSSARDGRALSQIGLATFHSHFDNHAFSACKPVREGMCGPCPLLKIADFLGYDQDVSKPGASARAEQQLACF